MNYSRIGEVLYGAFNDILRTAGLVVGMDKLDAMRMRCEDLGMQLERIVHNKAIGTTKKLQQATLEGFASFEKEQDVLAQRVAALEAIIAESHHLPANQSKLPEPTEETPDE